MNKDIFRIIDANLNRSREGLRVCEEVCRFILADAKLTGEFKKLRARFLRSIKRLPGLPRVLIASRNTNADVGKNCSSFGRKNYQDVFLANIQRVKESLRVLEEFSKIINRPLSNSFSRMRFKVYQLEKKTVAKF